MLKLLFLFTTFVFIEFAHAQLVDSARVVQAQPPFPYHKAALMAAIPSTLVGIACLIRADELSDFINASENVPNLDLNQYESTRDQYRYVAYTSIALSIATVIWNVAEGEGRHKTKRVQGQPWWMPKEKATGISARINL